MIQYFSADYVVPITSEPIRNGVVAMENGVIVGIYDEIVGSMGDVNTFSGVLIPGFINSHCHLELSHMLGMIHQKTGLVAFITQVIGK